MSDSNDDWRPAYLTNKSSQRVYVLHDQSSGNMTLSDSGHAQVCYNINKIKIYKMKISAVKMMSSTTNPNKNDDDDVEGDVDGKGIISNDGAGGVAARPAIPNTTTTTLIPGAGGGHRRLIQVVVPTSGTEKKSSRRGSTNKTPDVKKVPASIAITNSEHANNARELIHRFEESSIVCFTDGACKGNPGPCGSGAAVCIPTTQSLVQPDRMGRLARSRVGHQDVGEWHEQSRGHGMFGTNNIGELHAVGIALDLILCAMEGDVEGATSLSSSYAGADTETVSDQPAEKRQRIESSTTTTDDVTITIATSDDINPPSSQILARTAPIHILSDSKYTVGVLYQGWKAAKNVELVNMLKRKIEIIKTTTSSGGSRECHLHWVKGHAGIPGNVRADELANEGVQLSRNDILYYAPELPNQGVFTAREKIASKPSIKKNSTSSSSSSSSYSSSTTNTIAAGLVGWSRKRKA